MESLSATAPVAPITQEVYGYDGKNDYDFGQTALSWLGIGNQQREAAYNERMARLQMEREDTAYQRAVEDMRKAGLNPALMYGQSGNGGLPANASSRASGSNENGLTNLLSGITRLVSTAIAVSKVKTPTRNVTNNNYIVK